MTPGNFLFEKEPTRKKNIERRQKGKVNLFRGYINIG